MLAFPSSSLIPGSTPMKVLSADPPVGIGPYKFGKIVPNASYVLVKNPTFASFNIPGIPTGSVGTVDVNVDSNTQTEAQQVLDNQADIFDPGDTLPASRSAAGPAADEPLHEGGVGLGLLLLPEHAGRAVQQQVRPHGRQHGDRPDRACAAVQRFADAGVLLPAADDRRPQQRSCSYGDPAVVPSAATVAKAKSMIAAAGDAGAKVTVWSETRSPRQQFCAYFADLLNKLGFHATLKVIADSTYFQTIGNQSLNAQTGFADWSQDFPNPSDFYLLLSKAGIQATNNENFGNVDDPKIESRAGQARRGSRLAACVVNHGAGRTSRSTSCRQALHRAVRLRDSTEVHIHPGGLRSRGLQPRVLHGVQHRLSSTRTHMVDTSVVVPAEPAGTTTDLERAVPARHAAAPAQPPRAVHSAVVFLLIVLMCLFAPLYANHIAHTGPNSEHISEVIKVNGKTENVVSTDRHPDRADLALEVPARRRPERPRCRRPRPLRRSQLADHRPARHDHHDGRRARSSEWQPASSAAGPTRSSPACST